MPTRAKASDSLGEWFGLSMDMWMLGLESSSVIALRTMKLAAGGAAAQLEAERMVSEKVSAGMALAQDVAFGRLSEKGSGQPEAADEALGLLAQDERDHRPIKATPARACSNAPARR
jgi:hypothetical protein